jgi:alpha-D-ribose 1-methylphosphonate 5-phosphate C-P lyase
LALAVALGKFVGYGGVSVEVTYDDAKTWVMVRVTGVLGLDDVLRLIGSARADVEHRMWPMLFDARSATTTTTERDVEAAVVVVAEAVRSQGLRGHVALIADDDVLYARMLLYETRCAEAGVKVIRAFKQRPDAERWLAIVSAARYFQ